VLRLQVESAPEGPKAKSAFVSDGVSVAALWPDSTQSARNAVRYLPKSERAHAAPIRTNCNQRRTGRFRSIRSLMPPSARRESFVQSVD
jgi:hypothetical protein